MLTPILAIFVACSFIDYKACKHSVSSLYLSNDLSFFYQKFINVTIIQTSNFADEKYIIKPLHVLFSLVVVQLKQSNISFCSLLFCKDFYKLHKNHCIVSGLTKPCSYQLNLLNNVPIQYSFNYFTKGFKQDISSLSMVYFKYL